VPGGGVAEGLVARIGEHHVARPPVLGAGPAHQEPPALEAGDHVGQARQRGVRACRQGAHAQHALRRVGEHPEHEVLEVREAGVPAQLGVEHRGQEFDEGRQAYPRRGLGCVQSLCTHRTSVLG